MWSCVSICLYIVAEDLQHNIIKLNIIQLSHCHRNYNEYLIFKFSQLKRCKQKSSQFYAHLLEREGDRTSLSCDLGVYKKTQLSYVVAHLMCRNN